MAITQSENLPQLKTDLEAAEFLGQSVKTLQVWRSTGRYNLPYVKLGRKCFYRDTDLAAFVERRVRGGL